MIQDVKFLGLSHSPSDYEAQDGELATCLNLINEDGALHPIPHPEVVDKEITIPDGATIELVHKVTHDQDIHSHYIVRNSDDTWYWLERGGNGTAHTIDLSGFHVNAVTAVGNILSFVGDNSTMYAYWSANDYIPFDLTAFSYSATITNQKDEQVNVSANLADDWDDAFEKNSRFNNNVDVSYKGASIIFTALDALVNQQLQSKGKEYFKYTSFGVLAVLLYDGTTYTNISTPFILAPRTSFNKFIWYQDNKACGTSTSIHTHTINVQMNIPKGLEDLILGVDVFLTPSESFIDTEKRTRGISRNKCYLWNDKMASGVNCDIFSMMSADKVRDTFENTTFYLSVSIPREKFGTDVQLQRILQTEQPLSLADLKRSSFGGQCAITYNNRLHIANIKQSIYNAFDTNILCNRKTIENTSSTAFGATPYVSYDSLYLNGYFDIPVDTLTTDYVCDAVFRVSISENSIKRDVYYKGKLQYPISPILAYPSLLATQMQIYFYLPRYDKYFSKTVSLRPSNTFGMSYYLHVNGSRHTDTAVDRQSSTSLEDMGFGERADVASDDKSELSDYMYRFHDDEGLPTFIQKCRYKLLRKEKSSSIGNTTTYQYYWDETPIDTTDLTEITKAQYDEALSRVSTDRYVSQHPNVVKVSESENPLVFPASGSVQIGSSIIHALAANTRPISEGQFGDAPLYAFTDEGVWVLMLSTDGTYVSRQPVNREICTNPKGILQIDNAILYPTERGIMLQQGSESVCITDALYDYNAPFDFTKLYKSDYAKKVLAVNGTPEAEVQYIPFVAYLPNADMIYNYYDNRIILFNPEYPYAYVYSLKSKMWTTMSSNFKARVNIYPDAYAINQDGKIVDAYVKQPLADVPYFLCSRPLSLSSKEVHKTMFAFVTRGYFNVGLGKCGMILYGSNDLFNWFAIHTSVNRRLGGMAGSPYKYFRIALIGKLSPDESISGLSCVFQERWQNKLR